ncbi:hypothetical protein [Paraburkholderia rhizosphaerae]|uniref:hypothetical protein n=1 Tax=Paraburkholderia rhizosphaerae TaxID=480658 RepID=UPI00106648A0|nr:hypothetical protein [Paraburkholderia rhizosphaerae]
MMKTLVRAPDFFPVCRGSEPAIALRCSRRRKQGEPVRLSGHPHCSFDRTRTSLASAPAQRLF